MSDPNVSATPEEITLTRTDTGETLPARPSWRKAVLQASTLAAAGIPVLLTRKRGDELEERLYLPEWVEGYYPYRLRCPRCRELRLYPVPGTRECRECYRAGA